MAEQIELELRRLTVAPVRWIVNTHWHGDHTGANVRFGHGAVILAHANTRSRLMIEQRPPWEPVPVPALPAHAWPDIAITEPTTIYVNGEPIDLLPMPFGHSDGDLVVHFTWSRVASVGDLVVFRDGEMRPAPSPWSGGDAARLAAHLDTLTRRLPPDVIVLPGHGPPLTRADLEASSGLLKAILGVVRSRLAAGWSIERATSDAMPPEVTARLPWRISEPAWLQVVGQSLASPKRPSP